MTDIAFDTERLLDVLALIETNDEDEIIRAKRILRDMLQEKMTVLDDFETTVGETT